MLYMQVLNGLSGAGQRCHTVHHEMNGSRTRSTITMNRSRILPRRTFAARYQRAMDDAVKGINRCIICEKVIRGNPNPPGYYECWDCVDAEE